MTGPDSLLCWRIILFLVMACQLTANIYVEREYRRPTMFLMYHNLGTLLTFLVTFLNLIATCRYKNNLANFKIGLKNLQEDYNRRVSTRESTVHQAKSMIEKAKTDKINRISVIDDDEFEGGNSELRSTL